jgi:hypothetical protein
MATMPATRVGGGSVRRWRGSFGPVKKQKEITRPCEEVRSWGKKCCKGAPGMKGQTEGAGERERGELEKRGEYSVEVAREDQTEYQRRDQLGQGNCPAQTE